MDVFQLELANDPRVSPDGKWVVYVRRSMDPKVDRMRSQVWLVATAEPALTRPLNGNWGQRSPRWSPDGSRLAYIANDRQSGRNQIFIHWLESGVSSVITRLEGSPSSLTWSPDGSRLAFTQAVVAPPKPSWLKLPQAPDGATWAPKLRVVDKLIYRRDGGGYVDEESYSQIFTVASTGGAPAQLTSGSFDHSGPLSFSPTGELLYFAANRKPEWRYESSDTEVYRLDVESRELTALTSRHGPDESPAVSPDGGWIAYVGHDERYQGYQISRLYLMRTDGSERRRLGDELDRSVGSPQWAPDGKSIYVEYTNRGIGRIAKIGLDGTVHPWLQHVGGTSIGRPYGGGSYHVGASGDLVFTQSGPHQLAEVVHRSVQGGPLNPLTALSESLFSQRELGVVREVWAKSGVDERPIQGWLILPPGHEDGQRHPLILEIHGGPFADYGPRFAMELQLFAAAGYAVLYVNPRGSSSYGEEFGNLIHHAYPGNDYHDLMASVDIVIAEGFADPDQLYVTGGSGGGVLTAWIIGKTQRFKAAVVAKPVINWFSFVLTADAYPFFAKYWFPAPPWEAVEHYYARSPISLVGNVETPTLLITGEEDYRTPISETEQYYQALKLRRIETAMVRVPGAGHGIARRPSHLIGKVAAILGWFEKHSGLEKHDGK